jgi:RHS repeat-associated protein
MIETYHYDAVSRHFTGKPRDSESGLDNFTARFDSSSMGRFTSPDPLMSSAKVWDPQSWNRYAYVRNNPLILIDPTGMREVTAEECAKDKRCVTVNINVIYDKSSNGGKGLTDAQKSAFEKQQLQDAKDEYGNADIHFNVTYATGELKIENNTVSVTGGKEGALNVVVTDQVLGAKSNMNGTSAISLIPANTADKGDLGDELAHHFNGDTRSFITKAASKNEIAFEVWNMLTDVDNHVTRLWTNTIEAHTPRILGAGPFNHNAAEFQKAIQPATKPQ